MDTVIRACHAGARELVAFCQGSFGFAMDEKLGENAFATVPREYTYTHKLKRHTCLKSVVQPHPTARDSVVSKCQDKAKFILGEEFMGYVSVFAYTTDEQNKILRYVEGLTILASEKSLKKDRMTPQEATLLKLDYIFNRAPRHSARDRPMRLKEYQPLEPNVENILKLSMKNGSVGDLGDTGECGHADSPFAVLCNRKAVRASQLMQLAEEYRAMTVKEIQYSGLSIKPEVAKKIKITLNDDGLYEEIDKKIRSIANASAIKYIMISCIFPTQNLERRGHPAGSFVGESVRRDYLNIMLCTWFEKTKETWARRGITRFGQFLAECGRRGFLCLDKDSYEATTKLVGAAIYMFQSAVHFPEPLFEQWKDDIHSACAEFAQPHVVLVAQGDVVKGINRAGSTESGGWLTLDGNTERLIEMQINFSLQMEMWYLRNKQKIYETQHDFVFEGVGEPPEIDDPEHELIVDKDCSSALGDDTLNLNTPLSANGFKAKWCDWKHGTITTGGPKVAWAIVDSRGRVINDPTEYQKTYMQLDMPDPDNDETWWVRAIRCAVRSMAKLLYAPHKLEVALSASRQSMYICGTKEAYTTIRVYYDLLLEEVQLIGEEKILADVCEEFQKEDYVHLPLPSSLKPPTWAECRAYLAPDENRMLAIPEQVAMYREFAVSDTKLGMPESEQVKDSRKAALKEKYQRNGPTKENN